MPLNWDFKRFIFICLLERDNSKPITKYCPHIMSHQICGFALNHTFNQTLETQYIGIFPNLNALEHDKILNLSPNTFFNCTFLLKKN